MTAPGGGMSRRGSDKMAGLVQRFKTKDLGQLMALTGAPPLVALRLNVLPSLLWSGSGVEAKSNGGGEQVEFVRRELKKQKESSSFVPPQSAK
jgi:hypothetical protein